MEGLLVNEMLTKLAGNEDAERLQKLQRDLRDLDLAETSDSRANALQDDKPSIWDVATDTDRLKSRVGAGLAGYGAAATGKHYLNKHMNSLLTDEELTETMKKLQERKDSFTGAVAKATSGKGGGKIKPPPAPVSPLRASTNEAAKILKQYQRQVLPGVNGGAPTTFDPLRPRQLIHVTPEIEQIARQQGITRTADIAKLDEILSKVRSKDELNAILRNGVLSGNARGALSGNIGTKQVGWLSKLLGATTPTSNSSSLAEEMRGLLERANKHNAANVQPGVRPVVADAKKIREVLFNLTGKTRVPTWKGYGGKVSMGIGALASMLPSLPKLWEPHTSAYNNAITDRDKLIEQVRQRYLARQGKK